MYRHLKTPLCALVTACALALGAAPAWGQATADCFDETEETPEGFGPTDITATTGNGKLSVALNDDATVTVLKWPSPSFYDQIKYRTTDRSERFMGAQPNEGAFLGLAFRTGSSGWKFSWLRDWSSRQRFRDDDGDEVVTRFRKRRFGLTVTVRDVVAASRDVLARGVTVARTKRSRVRTVRVISFANFNPAFSKIAQSPTDDWCTENDNDDGASWVKASNAVLHQRAGTDSSTGEPSGASIVMGFANGSGLHQIGPDTFAGNNDGRSAFTDSRDGKLSGRNQSAGPTDAAIADQLSLRGRTSNSTTVFIAGAFSRRDALSLLRFARNTGFERIANAKRNWWRDWLEDARLPARIAPRDIIRVAKRSLITIRQNLDDRRNMIVASIATQAPYGLDWVRDGSYINRALDQARQRGDVASHNIRYGQLQITPANPPNGGPPAPGGNWSQNYYADGVVGGSIPYEIDSTGLGIWTLWDHYTQTQNRDYLLTAEVYEAIQRAAHYLSDPAPAGCVDPTNNLPCVANEGGSETPSQSLEGAGPVWLGLDAAVKAAQVRGGAVAETNEAKWAARRAELRAAIDTQFFDDECGCYTQDYEVGSTLLWPVRFLKKGSARSDAQADVNWRHMARVLSGRETVGRYETKILLANAFAWGRDLDQLKKLRRGLSWVARVATTNETDLLGEAWMVYPPDNGTVTTMVSQPHATTHALFYLAALKIYGSGPYRF